METVEFTPEEAGLERRELSELAGGSPEDNAAWLRGFLAGEGSDAHNEAIALNVGALLWVSGEFPDLKAATGRALDAIRLGSAIERLDQLAARTSKGT